MDEQNYWRAGVLLAAVGASAYALSQWLTPEQADLPVEQLPRDVWTKIIPELTEDQRGKLAQASSWMERLVTEYRKEQTDQAGLMVALADGNLPRAIAIVETVGLDMVDKGNLAELLGPAIRAYPHQIAQLFLELTRAHPSFNPGLVCQEVTDMEALGGVIDELASIDEKAADALLMGLGKKIYPFMAAVAQADVDRAVRLTLVLCEDNSVRVLEVLNELQKANHWTQADKITRELKRVRPESEDWLPPW